LRSSGDANPRSTAYSANVRRALTASRRGRYSPSGARVRGFSPPTGPVHGVTASLSKAGAIGPPQAAPTLCPRWPHPEAGEAPGNPSLTRGHSRAAQGDPLCHLTEHRARQGRAKKLDGRPLTPPASGLFRLISLDILESNNAPPVDRMGLATYRRPPPRTGPEGHGTRSPPTGRHRPVLFVWRLLRRRLGCPVAAVIPFGASPSHIAAAPKPR
jgi:hypothetical protein